MYAGLCNADADYTIVMDADLQHPPALVPAMIQEIEKGYDCCAGMRKSRTGESKIKSAFSSLFYRINNRFTSVHLEPNAVDFRIMTRQMVDNIVRLGEVQSFRKLVRYAITGITSFSVVPLGMLTALGLVISLLSFLLITFTLIRKLVFGIDVSGYASLLIAVLFLGGMIELSLGILGEYISNIYLESKDRPIYIIQDSNIKDYK